MTSSICSVPPPVSRCHEMEYDFMRFYELEYSPEVKRPRLVHHSSATFINFATSPFLSNRVAGFAQITPGSQESSTVAKAASNDPLDTSMTVPGGSTDSSDDYDEEEDEDTSDTESTEDSVNPTSITESERFLIAAEEGSVEKMEAILDKNPFLDVNYRDTGVSVVLILLIRIKLHSD